MSAVSSIPMGGPIVDPILAFRPYLHIRGMTYRTIKFGKVPVITRMGGRI